jgi:hypothetical protein
VEALAVNLAVGAVGAVLGAAAAYLFQIREFKRLGKGAARAVYLELASNLTAARMGAAGNVLGGISRDLYTSEAARLSAYLQPEELLAIAWAYAMFTDAEAALATLRSGGGRKADDPERALLEQFAAAISLATRPLNARVWSDAERARLEQGVPGRGAAPD